MSILRKNGSFDYTPGSPGIPASPGTPGTPTVPGHFVTTYKYVAPNYVTFLADATPTKPAHYVTYPVGVYGFLPVSTYVQAVPAKPGTPPTPGVPATAASFRRSYNLGWTASARSIGSMALDGAFLFSFERTTIGAVAGIKDNELSTAYGAIQYGIYAANGLAAVIENGVVLTPQTIFASADVFKIERRSGQIKYYKNGTLFYTSLTPNVNLMHAAASMYSANDAITAPSFVTGAPLDAYSAGVLPLLQVRIPSKVRATATMQPLRTLASNKPYADGQAALLPLDAFGTAYTYAAVGGGVLPLLTSTNADHRYAYSSARMPPLMTEADAGSLQPPFAVSDATMPTLLTYSTGYATEPGIITSTLRPLVSLGANHPYAAGGAALAPLVAFGGEGVSLNAYAAIKAPMARLRASASPRAANALNVTLPAPMLRAYGGDGATLTAPAARLLATGTGVRIGRMIATAPAARLSAHALAGSVARLQAAAPSATLRAFTGAVLSAKLHDGYALDAHVVAGGRGRLTRTMPMFRLVASSTHKEFAQARLTAPMAYMTGVSRATLTAPMARLEAIGTATVVMAYEAYAVNLLNSIEGLGRGEVPIKTVTRYTNFPFTQIVRMGEDYFGIGADGIFLLGGNLDDTAPINWKFQMTTNDFGSAQLKRPQSLYIDGRIEKETIVTLVVGEKETDSYSYQTVRGQNAQNYRVPVGKGLRSRYYSIGLSDPAGNYIEVSGLEFLLSDLKRAI